MIPFQSTDLRLKVEVIRKVGLGLKKPVKSISASYRDSKGAHHAKSSKVMIANHIRLTELSLTRTSGTRRLALSAILYTTTTYMHIIYVYNK